MTLRTTAFAAIAAMVSFPAMAQECDIAEGEKVFRKCQACHQVGEDAKNRVGPILNNNVDNEIASAEGFNYSDAFMSKKEEGFVWTPDALHQYLLNPRDYIEGNRMAFAGLKKEEDRAQVICYMQTFNES